jgi:hypothetical protein
VALVDQGLEQEVDFPKTDTHARRKLPLGHFRSILYLPEELQNLFAFKIGFVGGRHNNIRYVHVLNTMSGSNKILFRVSQDNFL